MTPCALVRAAVRRYDRGTEVLVTGSYRLFGISRAAGLRRSYRGWSSHTNVGWSGCRAAAVRGVQSSAARESASQSRTSSVCWPSSGGAVCCRCHSCTGGVEEPQRRPGQLDRTEHGVLDVDQQALRPGLVPVVDLLQVLDLAAGHADLRTASPAGRGSSSRRTPASTAARTTAAVAHPLGVAGELRSGQRDAEGGCEPGPQSLRTRRRSARRRRRSGTARRGRWTDGAGPRPWGPRRPPSTGCPGRRARRPRWPAARCGPARRGRCWPARAASRAPRRRRTSRPAGRRSARPTLVGVSGSGPGHRHQTGLALGDLVVAGPAALRPVVAETGDRQHHQRRVELGQPLPW